MLHLALALALHLAPLQKPDAPSPDAIKGALMELKSAFEKGKAPERVTAIESASNVVDASVIEWIAKGLRDGDMTVQAAAIEALRFMGHPDALASLTDMFKREKKLPKAPELCAKLIKAIGQHAAPTSLTLLAEGGITDADYKIIEARILAVANIRSERAVEELIAMMRTAGRDKVAPYMPTFRLALMRLTGADEGVSQDTWMTWWNDHKKGFKVAETAPLLPKEMQLRWDYFWGNPIDDGRAKKRGERGNDPEKGK